MSIEIIKPESTEHWLALRAQDVTSTEVAALFGCSPYMTKFELWHRKKAGTVVELEANDRMKWGVRLQDAIASGIAEDHGLEIRKMPEYIRRPDRRAGSSFDFAVGDDGLLEVKNVDSLAFRDGWLVDEDGHVEAPPHIELQVQHQLWVSGRKVNNIGCLVGGNRVVRVERPYDAEVGNAIDKAVREFWESIEANEPPPPNFEQDAQFIAHLYSRAAEGKVYDATSDTAIAALAEKYRQLGDQAKVIDQEREAVKAQLLMTIGDHDKVIGKQFTISAGVVGECQMNFVRKAYRNLRINWKKEKA